VYDCKSDIKARNHQVHQQSRAKPAFELDFLDSNNQRNDEINPKTQLFRRAENSTPETDYRASCNQMLSCCFDRVPNHRDSNGKEKSNSP
jgi:hypothetical protein